MEGTEAETREVVRLYQAGNWAEARQRCLQGLELGPQAGLLHLLALVELQQGQQVQALEHAQAALSLSPESAPLLNSLAAIYRQLGQDGKAEPLLRRALELDGELTAAHFNLGRLLQGRGAWSQARAHFERALQADPQSAGQIPADLAARQGWLSCLLARATVPLEQEVRLELERCFGFIGLDLQSAGQLVFLSLTYESSWPGIQAAARQKDLVALRDRSRGLWQDRLLQLALQMCVCTDPEVEEVITAWRRALALLGIADQTEMARSLALHCRNHEFIQSVSEEEEQKLGLLSERLDEESQLIVSMYQSQTPALECDLVSLTEIADEVSLRVQQQYEQHPYPRWLSLHRHSPLPLSDVVEQACATRPEGLDVEKCHLLVAGCGTGRATLSLATQIAAAEILAVDLSRASLAYAQQMSESLQIANVQFAHGDILKLGSLEQRFHAIDCSGVLHHMAAPLQGWRVLRGLLLPGAVMRVGLYSRRARSGISAAREMARGFAGSRLPQIRAWRRAILELPLGHPARDVLKVEDFYSTSMCRDLAFHVQEQLFDIAEIEAMLEQLELDLLGFELPDKRAHATFSALFGDQEARQRPALWAAFERLYPDTFVGMYSFWCRCPRRGG